VLDWRWDRFRHAASQFFLPLEHHQLLLIIEQPLIAVQTVLDISQVPVGTSVIIFVQTLGGALFVSVGKLINPNFFFSRREY
jgi:hypothetical protein